MTAKKMKYCSQPKDYFRKREWPRRTRSRERIKGRVSQATNNEMLGQVQFEEIHTEPSFHNQMKMKRVTTPPFLMYSRKLKLEETVNWLFRALSLGAFGDQEYHLIVREMLWDYIDTNRNRFKEFIDQEMASYIINMRKSRT